MKKKPFHLTTKLGIISLMIVGSTSFFISCNKDSLGNDDSKNLKETNKTITESRQAISSLFIEPTAPEGYKYNSVVTFSDNSTLTFFKNDNDNNHYKANWNQEEEKIYDVYTTMENNGIIRLSIYLNDVLIKGDLVYAPEGGYPGDCSKLGGRGETETYEDCYARNFSNFCCDFTSCASFALMPIPIMAGIGLACMTIGAPIVINYVANATETIYTRPNM